MKNRIQIIFWIFVIAYLALMCFLIPEHRVGLIIALVFLVIISVTDYNDMNENDELLQIKLSNDCLEIIDKQECINIPINEIEYCESIIQASYTTDIGASFSFSHRFLVHTASKKYEFEFPDKIRENLQGVPQYVRYDEIFDLFNLNLPNFKYTFIGNINHIKKDIEYYSKYHKRQNLIKRYYLYFLDLPFLPKLKNILLIVVLICFLFLNLALIMLYLFPFLRDHGVFF